MCVLYQRKRNHISISMYEGDPCICEVTKGEGHTSQFAIFFSNSLHKMTQKAKLNWRKACLLFPNQQTIKSTFKSWLSQSDICHFYDLIFLSTKLYLLIGCYVFNSILHFQVIQLVNQLQHQMQNEPCHEKTNSMVFGPT